MIKTAVVVAAGGAAGFALGMGGGMLGMNLKDGQEWKPLAGAAAGYFVSQRFGLLAGVGVVLAGYFIAGYTQKALNPPNEIPV